MSDNPYSGGLSSPGANLLDVTPDDSTDLPATTRALFVGVGGAVRVITLAGQTANLTSADSQYHPIRVRRVLATGTTATGIVALW